MKLRTILSVICYCIVPLALIVASILNPEKGFFEELGWFSLELIILILYMKPIARILDSKLLTRLLPLRRQLGVAAFWFFLFHAAGLTYVMGLWDATLFVTVPYLFWGAVAGIGMVLLGLTSNTISVRFLKKNWKRLHYIAYPTFFAAVIHAVMADGGELGFAIGSIAVFILLKTLEWKGFTIKKFFKDEKKEEE